MTNYIARGRSIVMPLTNNSGGSVGKGDVVIVDTADAGFTTTITEKQTTEIVGVAMETIAAAADGRICVGGFVEVVNLNNSAGYGDFLYTDDVVKFGIASATLESGAFGQALDSGATPPAVLYIKPERFIDADPVWEAKGDILVGTGPNAAAIVSIGSNDDVLTVSGGTAVWAPPAAAPVTPVDPTDFWFGAPYLAGYTTDGTYAIADSNSDNTFILLAGGYPNVHEGVFLETNALTKTSTSMIAPYTGTIELYNVFLMYMGGAAGGNFKYKWDVQVLTAGATTYSDGAPGTQATIAVTNSQNEIVYNQMGTTYNVTAGDVITCRIQANRGDAADTAGDAIQIWTLAGKYTA